MYLFITSTLTFSDLGRRLLILSWATYDIEGNQIEDIQEYLFKPVDFIIPIDHQKKLNISQQQALEHGDYSFTILSEFEKAINNAVLIVAFGIEMQLNTILNEFYINGLETNVELKARQCLQSGLNIRNYCSSVGGSSMSLESLHFSLFWGNDDLSEIDCMVKCFFHLLRKKAI